MDNEYQSITSKLGYCIAATRLRYSRVFPLICYVLGADYSHSGCWNALLGRMLLSVSHHSPGVDSACRPILIAMNKENQYYKRKVTHIVGVCDLASVSLGQVEAGLAPAGLVVETCGLGFGVNFLRPPRPIILKGYHTSG